MLNECKISVIIPAFNEANRIVETVDILHSLMTKWGYENCEIIVGDDGSTDKMGFLVIEKMKQYNNLSLIGYPINKGKGAILKKCFAAATGDIKLFIDADLAISPMLIKPMIELILDNKADVVIASKHLPSSKIDTSFVRRFLSKSYAFLAKLILGINISDFQCGLKAFRKNVMIDILPRIKNEKFLGDTEMVARAYAARYKIIEIPAIVSNKGESTVSIVSGTWGMLCDLIKLRYELRRIP